MIAYSVIDQSGSVVKTGTCQKHMLLEQGGDGLTVVEGVTHQRVVGTSGCKNSYNRLRQTNYPCINDQLDALWHGMNGDSSKRIEPFYSMLKKVKDDHPKNTHSRDPLS